MHTELRVRTICELSLNEDFYLQPCITSQLDPDGARKVVSKNALVATCNTTCLEKAKGDSIDCDFAKSVLHEECLLTTKDGTYSTMWHVYGLASVLKLTIMSLYPDFNVRYRSMFHKECHPRNASSEMVNGTCYIMWSRLGSYSSSPNPWSPNHL